MTAILHWLIAAALMVVVGLLWARENSDRGNS